MITYIARMRIAVKFAYDGRIFHGYARQPHLKTVDGELINALMKYGIIHDTEESRFRSASRTDKGVSALCNVIASNTDFTKNRILTDKCISVKLKEEYSVF